MCQVKTQNSLILVREAVKTYASCIFEDFDFVEVRRLPCGRSTWYNTKELPEEAELLIDDNQQDQHIYIGGNPRQSIGGTKNEDVACARCLFADFDGVKLDEVEQRWQAAGLPAPTITVASGHGFHTYWRLTKPICDMVLWSQLQQRLIATLDSDKAIHDPARIMRLPGFRNHKEPPAACTIIEADPSRRYALSTLAGRLKLLRDKQLIHSDHFVKTTEQSQLDILGRATLAASKWPPVVEGERNSKAFRNSAYLVKDFGLTEAQAWPILVAWNGTNQPPLPENELRKCLQSAIANGKHPIRRVRRLF